MLAAVRRSCRCRCGRAVSGAGNVCWRWSSCRVRLTPGRVFVGGIAGGPAPHGCIKLCRSLQVARPRMSWSCRCRWLAPGPRFVVPVLVLLHPDRHPTYRAGADAQRAISDRLKTQGCRCFLVPVGAGGAEAVSGRCRRFLPSTARVAACRRCCGAGLGGLAPVSVERGLAARFAEGCPVPEITFLPTSWNVARRTVLKGQPFRSCRNACPVPAAGVCRPVRPICKCPAANSWVRAGRMCW